MLHEPGASQVIVNFSPGQTMPILLGVFITSLSLAAQSPAQETLHRLNVPIQAVRACDDDGSRPAAITPQQVERWVNFANEVYAPAGIQFHYQTSDGLGERKSTLLNNVTGVEDHNWLEAKRTGNKVAAGHRGKLTLIFRHGPGRNPTGGGFGAVDYDFVAMPGFEVTRVCGKQNIGVLAHEVGHYLGLVHTFAREFETLAQAESWLRNHKGEISSFDGDGLADTPPDPFISALQCGNERSVVLLGKRIPFPRENIMGYWDHPRPLLSRQQVEIVRWFLQRRQRSGMLLPTNREGRSHLEAEALKIIERRDVQTSVQSMKNFGAGSWSLDAQLFIAGKRGGSVTFDLPVERAGRYEVCVYLTMSPDFGRIQPWLDGRPRAPRSTFMCRE